MKTLVCILAAAAVMAIASAVMTACLPPTSPANLQTDTSEVKNALHELCTLRADEIELGLPESPNPIVKTVHKRLDSACLIVDGAPMPGTPGTSPESGVP